MLGIYGIYAKKSDFTGGSEDWAQYQISVSRIEAVSYTHLDVYKRQLYARTVRFNGKFNAYVLYIFDFYGSFG